jgi:hypothetical protein
MGATQWTPHPRRLKLALAFEVGQMKGNLPGSPRAVDGREALPIMQLLLEVLGCEDGSRGHHQQFNVSDWHASPLHFFLGILHHDNNLGDAICLNVVLGHVQAEGDHVDGMQYPTVGIKVGHDLKGCDLRVESLGILQIIVPNLVNNLAEELGDATLGCFIAGIVVKGGFVGGLSANTDNSRGVIGNVPVIEGEEGRPDELGAAIVGFVLGGSARMAMREWTPSNWLYGMTMRRGRRVSLFASTLSLVGFPLRGGKVS